MVVGAFMKTARRETMVHFSTPTILDAMSILHVQQDDLLNDVRKILIKAATLIVYIIIIGIAMGFILYIGDPQRAERYQKMNGKEFFMRSIITGIASVFGEMGFLSENTSLKSIPGAFITVFMMIVSFLLIMFTQAKITQKMLEIDSTYNPNNVRDKTFIIFEGDPVKEEFELYGAKLKEVDSDTSEQMVDIYVKNTDKYDGCILPYADAYFFQRTISNMTISSDFGFFTSHWIFNKNKATLVEDINATLLLLKEEGELKTLCQSKLGGDWQVPICSLF
jgi:ABC-type amino acid transport substrate-binding protein